MKKSFLLALSLFSTIVSFSQIGGQGAYEFQNVTFSGRAAALGGELVSWNNNDVQLVHHNPSTLSSVEKGKMGLSFVDYYSDIKFSQLFYNIGETKWGSFGGGVSMINYGDFVRAEANGVVTGEFSANDYMIHLNWSKKIDSLFSVGVDFKNIFSQYDVYRSYGMAVDLGASYFNPDKELGIGLVVNNLGSQITSYSGTQESVQPRIHLGFSKKLAHAPFRIHITAHDLQKLDISYEDPINPPATVDPLTNEPIEPKKNIGDKILRHANIGVEFVPMKNFNLRFGYNYQRQKEMRIANRAGLTGFSFGVGIKVKRFYIDYGRAKYHLSGATNHFTISTNLNSFFIK